MRTTLDIDSDVLEAAKALARKQRSTAGRVLSELARKSLTSSSTRVSDSEGRYGVPVIPATASTSLMTNDRVNKLMDDEGI